MVSIVVFSKPKDYTGNPPYQPYRYKWIDGDSSYRIGDQIRTDSDVVLEVMQVKRFDDEFGANNFVTELTKRDPFVWELD